MRFSASVRILKKEWCCKIVEDPIKVEKQEGNRGGLRDEVKLLSGY